jgi:tRNA 2-selenouridine synthase
MPAEKIPVEKFIQLAQTQAVFDVRSPGEFTQAHIPGVYSLPLFTDEERKTVGTAYKQQSREEAIKLGLNFFGPKMRAMVEEVERLSTSKNILIHCWRGGMRSAAVAWLLDMYGFKVHTLAGGYKAYRNLVLQALQKDYNFKIIGGYTGSGKTLLLHKLQQQNEQVLDLESLANHKGSALGSLGKGTQPRQEMFENLLAAVLLRADNHKTIWVEDESQRIGDIQVPMPLWNTMRKKPVYFFDIPFDVRLEQVTPEYKTQPKEMLVNAIIRIQKRLGGLNAKNAINYLLENNHKESFRILLKYYDKYYSKGLYNRQNADELVKKIISPTADVTINITYLQ